MDDCRAATMRIKRKTVVASKRSCVNCIMSCEASVWVDAISHKSNVHDLTFALNTPWRLIATAFNFYVAWWIIQVEYFHVVIWTVAIVPVAAVPVVVPLHIEVGKIQIDVVARCCSDRPKTANVIGVTVWIIRAWKISLTICKNVPTRSWEKRDEVILNEFSHPHKPRKGRKNRLWREYPHKRSIPARIISQPFPAITH